MDNKDKKEHKINISIPNILAAILFFPIIEKILSPIYDKAADKLLSVSNNGVQFISSFIYSRISEGVYINISFYIFVVIISVMLSFLLCTILLPYKKSSSCCDAISVSCCEKRKKINFFLKMRCFIFNPKRRIRFTIAGTILLYVIFALFIFTTNFINNTITRTTNNIEIVSPYIDDNEYKMLKSKFHSMRTRTDYDNLNSLLKQYSSEFGVELK